MTDTRMQPILSRAGHRITQERADRQTRIDFPRALLAMPFVVAQRGRARPVDSRPRFDPGDGRRIDGIRSRAAGDMKPCAGTRRRIGRQRLRGACPPRRVSRSRQGPDP